jgi:hypothetical protein
MYNMDDSNNYDSDDSDGSGPVARCGGASAADCIDLTLSDTDEEVEVQPSSRLRRSKRKAANAFRSAASRSTAVAATEAIHRTVTQSSASDDSSASSRFSEDEVQVQTKKKLKTSASKKRSCKKTPVPKRKAQKRANKQNTQKTQVKSKGKTTKVNSRKYGAIKQVSGPYFSEFDPLLVTKEIKQAFYLRWLFGNDKLKVREIGGKDECKRIINDGKVYELFCSKFLTRDGQSYCRYQHEGELRMKQNDVASLYKH